MALSDRDESILAEFEKEMRGFGVFDSAETVEDEVVAPKGGRVFDAKRALLGVFGLLFGFAVILFAVYSYSNFGVFVTVLLAAFGFAVAMHSISQLLRSFSSRSIF